MFQFSRRTFLLIIILVFCFTFLPLFRSSIQAQEIEVTPVYGRVVDSVTNHSISDAAIIFWDLDAGLITKTKTNESGSYNAEVIGFSSFKVYAYYDDESTLGFDYVPACQVRYLGGFPENLSFALMPGASIVAEGDLKLLRFFEFPIAPVTVSFTVFDQFRLLSGTGAVTEYGEDLPINQLLNLSARTILVPSNTPVKVAVSMDYSPGKGYLTIDSEGDYLNLAQGSQLTVNLRFFLLKVELDPVYTRLQTVQTMMSEVGKAGFYASYESIKISRAENLIEKTLSALNQGDYDVAYADLHEAYLIIEDLETTLPEMYTSVSHSVLFITPFLGFTAVAVASVLFDERSRRFIVSLCLYGSLLGLLYFLYPGFSILQKPAYNPLAGTAFENLLIPILVGTSFLAAFFVILILPYIFREKTVRERLRLMSALSAAFSVAARNLRRRKLRTSLTSAFLLTSVFAFIVLTSFSSEHGFFIEKYRGKALSEGFLIRQGPIDRLTPFERMEPAVIQWLKEHSESSLVVPKIEKKPILGYRPVLSEPRSRSSLHVWELGVFPSLEVKVTKMDSIITRGRFLSDRDLNGILISEDVAETLQVEVNETVQLQALQEVEVGEVAQIYDRNFTVTGIFSSEKLGALRDLDGAPLNPQRIIRERAPPPYMWADFLEYVRNERVVIMHGETAQKLAMGISRVDIQTWNPEDIVDLARLSVLVWPNVQAFASVSGGIRHLFIGSSHITKGFAEVMVPLALMTLNVGIMMLTTVYERKREVTIMSTVGLNPFHISAMFVAEAIVIGVVAGSLGYLLGLFGYRFLALFSISLAVKQKIEAFWAVFALGFSIAATVLGSMIPDIKASVVATPSLLRKWKITVEERPRTAREPWVLKIPLGLRREELKNFFNFMEKRLEKYASGLVEEVADLTVSEKEAEPRLSFTYVFREERIVTDNELIPVKIPNSDHYTIKLVSQPRMSKQGVYAGMLYDEAQIRRTASFIRRLILEYSYQQASH